MWVRTSHEWTESGNDEKKRSALTCWPWRYQFSNLLPFASTESFQTSQKCGLFCWCPSAIFAAVVWEVKTAAVRWGTFVVSRCEEMTTAGIFVTAAATIGLVSIEDSSLCHHCPSINLWNNETNQSTNNARSYLSLTVPLEVGGTWASCGFACTWLRFTSADFVGTLFSSLFIWIAILSISRVVGVVWGRLMSVSWWCYCT